MNAPKGAAKRGTQRQKYAHFRAFVSALAIAVSGIFAVLIGLQVGDLAILGPDSFDAETVCRQAFGCLALLGIHVVNIRDMKLT